MAANNQIVKKSIQIDAGDTLRTVKSLKQEISDLRDELLNLEKGTEEYDEVQQKLHDDVEDLNEVMGAHKDKAEALEGSYNALQNELKELKKAWKETNDEAERDVLGQKINDLNNQLKEMDASIGDFHRNVGNYESAWNGLTSVMENGEKVTDDLEKGIKAFGTALGMSDKQVNALSKSLKALKDGFHIAKDMAKAKEETAKAATATTQLATAQQTAAGTSTTLATSQKATGAAAKTMAASENTATVATKGLSVAMTGLKAAIVATGIGALIVLLGQLIGQLDEARIKLKLGRNELYQKTEDASAALIDNADVLVAKREKQIERTTRELEALGKTEKEVLDARIEGYKNLKEELQETLDMTASAKTEGEEMLKEFEKQFNVLKALHPTFGLIMDKLGIGPAAGIKTVENSVSAITESIKNLSGAIETTTTKIDDVEFDKYIEDLKEANKELNTGAEQLRKWDDLINDPKFLTAWKTLFQIDFTGASPIETLKSQMAAATALVKQFKGDTSEVERLFTELISEAEAEWKSLVEKEQQIFDERLTPAQRLENEKAEWVTLAERWGMDAVEITRYYDQKIQAELDRAEEERRQKEQQAEDERLEALQRRTDEQLQMMEAALSTQEKMNDIFNPMYMTDTAAGDIQQEMDNLQALYDTQMEYLNNLLASADLTEEAYQGVEDRIVSLTVAFNSQMNTLKQEADYQGKNWAILSRKGVANFQLLEGAAADFSSTFQSLGLENSVAYKGFATAQAIISSILAANRVLAEEPGGAIIKGIAAAATLAAGLANVAAIWAVNPDGSNAGSSMNTSMEQPAVPVIGNAQPINYTRNITTAAEEDEMNQPIYVTVTDIEDGINGRRAQVENSSF